MYEFRSNDHDLFFMLITALENKVKELEERLAKAEEKNRTLEERIDYHTDWLSSLTGE